MIFEDTWQSFLYALKGLKTVWKEERNFRIEIVVAIIIAIVAYYFNFSFAESSLIAVAIIIVLMSEIINTVVEDLCNKIEPGQNAKIGKIKDVGASLSLVSSIGALVLGILVFAHHFFI